MIVFLPLVSVVGLLQPALMTGGFLRGMGPLPALDAPPPVVLVAPPFPAPLLLSDPPPMLDAPLMAGLPPAVEGLPPAVEVPLVAVVAVPADPPLATTPVPAVPADPL